MLESGDPLPSLIVNSLANPRYNFDTVAGRKVLVVFVGSLSVPGVGKLVADIYANSSLFDDRDACCFIVSSDPADQHSGILRERYPGIRIIWDFDGNMARACGIVSPHDASGERIHLASFILDPALRVLSACPIENTADHADKMFESLRTYPSPSEDFTTPAPVLLVPGIFEPEFCRDLVGYAKRAGTEDSGFMRSDPVTIQTVAVVDYNHKRRRDCLIEDEALRNLARARVFKRLIPQIQRAFQFKVTRMERDIVACYDESGGYFRPHRDNTTAGTAHRRFAVSINLNAEEFEGGNLRFPQFGRRTYRPPTGGAVVFSCSLLHEALPVTKGTRYVFLPFLYDEEAAKIRLENAQHIADPELREKVVTSILAKPAPLRV